MSTNRCFPKLLTYIGIVPFFGLALGLWADASDKELCGAALVSYSALVLSFLGGIHWGLALTGSLTGNARNMMFIESAVFVLAAWTIALSPVILPYKLIGLMILFGNVWVVDKLYARRLSLPEWFLPTRSRVTVAVMLALVLAAGATL